VDIANKKERRADIVDAFFPKLISYLKRTQNSWILPQKFSELHLSGWAKLPNKHP
jgi:hypothetical protein